MEADKSKWASGSWTIEWEDCDTVKIIGPYNQIGRLCGGDFESMLSALCSAYNEGCRKAK